MPYTITTTTPVRPRPANDWRTRAKVSRHAVTTLEKAQLAAWGIVQGRTWDSDVSAYQAASDKARTLPKDGGTIGPLPDGTVIEVVLTTDAALLATISTEGIDVEAYNDAINEGFPVEASRIVCDAWNEQRKATT